MSYNFSFSFPPEGVLLQNIQLTQDLCFQSGKYMFLGEKELSIRIVLLVPFHQGTYPSHSEKQKCVDEHLALF